ncbi:MAG TPA: hypothetical protein VEC35_14485 [Noviherbaspirillum sp.]|nr:hypothetical protein [Noviherbaspirillum sp.]
MSPPISTVGQLVSVIRAQFASRSEFTSLQRRPYSGHGTAANRTSTYNPENLESLIRLRIKNIDPADLNRGRKAFRVFLEAILLSHFGETLINDPKFYQLVDDVQLSMEQDSQIRKLIETVTDHLISLKS